jgi:hypothetical protein
MFNTGSARDVRELSPGAAPGRMPALLTRDGVLFLFAFGLRLLLTVFWLNERGVRGGLELGALSESLLAGDGFVWHFYGSDVPRHSFFPPFYPYLLASAKSLAGLHWVTVVQALQIGASALAPVFVRRLGACVMRADLAWLAAYTAALWPPFVLYSAELFSVSFHIMGVPLILLLLVRARRPGWRQPAVAAGLCYGLLAYSLPSFLGSLAIMPAGLRWTGVPWKRAFGISGLALATAVVVLAPWTLRNFYIHGRIVPVATNLGFNLLGANNPHARAEENVLCPYDDIRWSVIDRDRLENMNEVDFDRMLTRQAIGYMVDHPLETVRRMGTRTLYYWWFIPKILRLKPLEGLGGMILMTLTLPLFLIGLGVSLRLRRDYPFGVLYAACGWVTLFYMNFAVRGRYALAIQPVMIILAVLGTAATVRHLRMWYHSRTQLRE